MPDTVEADLVGLTADLVSAYLANNAVPASELPGLIGAVHGALVGVATGARPSVAPADKPAPAVPVRKSVTPDHLVSLEDGRKYQTLKRHLAGLGLTPDEYRAKWGLPANYPMVAPNYSKRRSELAKAVGLGRKADG